MSWGWKGTEMSWKGTELKDPKAMTDEELKKTYDEHVTCEPDDMYFDAIIKEMERRGFLETWEERKKKIKGFKKTECKTFEEFRKKHYGKKEK